MAYGKRRLSKLIAALVILFSAYVFHLYRWEVPSTPPTPSAPPHSRSYAPSLNKPVIERSALVEEVVDGDTVIVHGGERVRYLGINAPEMREPYYMEARERNASLVSGREVRLSVCVQEPVDRYGRTLAWVYSDGVEVNKALLEEGLARALIISPCAKARRTELLGFEGEAKGNRRGVWGGGAGGEGEGEGGGRRVSTGGEFVLSRLTPSVSPPEAVRHIGEKVLVTGKVLGVHKGKKAVFINFGADYRRDFTAVIFEKGLREFSVRGVDPALYSGRIVALSGIVRRYRGRAEIVVEGPGQITVLGE